MKNLVMCFITLCLVSETFAKAKVREPSSYKVEKGTFSSLILSKDELAALSPEDRTTYLFTLINFVQILEISQSRILGKKDNLPLIKKTSSLNRYEIWLQAVETKVYAAKILQAAGHFAGLAMAGGAKSFLKIPTLVTATKQYMASQKIVTAATKVMPVATDIKTAETILMTGLKEHKAASTALDAAKPGTAGYQQVVTKYNDALNELSTATVAFQKFGGTPAHKETLKKLMEKEGAAVILPKQKMSTGVALSVGAAAGVVGTKVVEGSLTQKEFVASVGATDLAAIPAPPLVAASGVKPTAAEFVQITGAAVKTATTGDTNPTNSEATKKAADEAAAAPANSDDLVGVQEAARSCVFGGHPSIWKDFGGTLYCTRPAESATEDCQGERFSCQTYGLSTADGVLDGKLCTEKNPLDNLTIRCSKILTEVLMTKKSDISEAAYEKFRLQIKTALKNVENTAGMKDGEGKTISIQKYCKSAKVSQKNECTAINEVVDVLNTTEVKDVIASRVATETAKPGVESTGTGTESPNRVGQ